MASSSDGPRLEFSIPEHWEAVPLQSVVTQARRSIDPREYPDEVFDYYSIPAYQDRGAPTLERGQAIGSQKLLVDPGTVLFGKLNPRVPKVWRVANG